MEGTWDAQQKRASCTPFMDITLPPFIIIVLLGILPSLAWLFYFLKKDRHPEPKKLILQLFLLGFLLPPFVGFGEILLQQSITGAYQIITLDLLLFLIAAFWEEGAKYLAARSVFHHEKEFDELTDGMIYLVTVALGFAASENIIHALSGFVGEPHEPLFVSIRVILLRSIGATLLHALASGVLGYFLTRSIFLKERFSLLKGFIAATAIHTLFNWFLYLQQVLKMPSLMYLVIALLTGGLIIILRDFSQLKRYDGQ